MVEVRCRKLTVVRLEPLGCGRAGRNKQAQGEAVVSVPQLDIPVREQRQQSQKRVRRLR